MKATHPDKAATLDNFCASPGWFQGVRKRHNIKSVRLHGEAGSVDEETAATAMAEFKQAVAATSITNPQFVFNADETGLFYQTLPSRLYVSRSERSVRGVKQMAAKARLTIMTATSAAGEKVPLFSVGKSRRPMCLRDDFPPVRYTSQASAWFDTDMANYYVRFFLKWKRSRYGDEPVVLIWDNCPAHKNVTNPAPKELHLLFLPPNLTSKHQPMDMGLISAVKMRYKAYVLQQLLAYYDDGQQTPLPKSRGLRGLAHGAPPNIRDALTILKRVWDEVKPESVVRCWMKAACLPESFFPQQHTQQQQRVTSDEMLTERSSEEEGQEGEGGQLVQDGLGAENEQYDEAEQRRTEEQEAIDEISHLAQSLQARVSIATDARVEVVAEGTEEWATSDDDPDIVNAMIDLELERIESNSSTTTTSSDDDGSDSDQDEATPTAPTRAERR
ncbi:hypothetical protein PTSG_11939 [Salpingoeca rosetta]|uniref:DDE-1 domain-containing protein n=1 Tax=Salpingoeca rosetta (strain ATCC 50818 / BSB-021) TaxID=946362 RepID=F2U3M0_SALR5|nr:uncharacterized protein PTSG_11939 [Salpingoeca rosetta]EGD82214.1 hypothetical protein PTSG_11939 [Salpingoeca rosetta]|eukprot:XP_004996397.1 hypothetical protein PTSG_11939 [Salpingoeca rosetta]